MIKVAHQVNTYNGPHFQFQVNRQRFDEDMRTGVLVANDMENLIWQGHMKYTIKGTITTYMVWWYQCTCARKVKENVQLKCMSIFGHVTKL
jgi:hypothetical protein